METAPNCIRWRFERRGLVTFGAVIMQAVLLFLSERELTGRLQILAIAALIALLQLAAARAEGRAWRAVGMAMGMTLFGGLGMALGGVIDNHGAASACMLCQAHALITWSLGLMLAFCFVGCRLFAPRTVIAPISRVCGDCLRAASMMAGMFVGEFLLAPVSRLEGTDPAVTHGVMLLGMFIGNLAAFGLTRLFSDGHLATRLKIFAIRNPY